MERAGATFWTRRRRGWTAGGLTALVLAAAVVAVEYQRIGRPDREALVLLRSPQDEARKLGAWLVAREHAPAALQYIADALDAQSETDAAVRESFVYALGRAGDPRFTEHVARVVREDPDAYVRQAAWVATARLDAARFRALAAEIPPRPDPWDQLGRACAWLELGDLRGVDTLLDAAVAEDEQQRRVVALALYRGVAPLLEAAGRWPIQYAVHEGQPWPAEVVAEVRRRAAELDLTALAADTRRHVAKAALVRRNVWRLHHTRDRLAAYLFRR